MPKTAVQFICQSCSASHSKWSGRCADCGAWNSMVETAVTISGKRGSSASGTKLTPTKLAAVDVSKTPRITSGISEFDQVLGGGIVPGSVMLLSGDPGIGKSTLVLQISAAIAKKKSVLYISGEESAAQIKLRAERLGLADSGVDLLTETDAESIAATIEAGKYELVIVDSIQTLSSGNLTGAAGSIGQITACSQALQQVAKKYHVATMIIGHVTKEGSIAGPKILEHLVDVVLYLEGERYGAFKALRAVKNRFGSTNEAGIFEMAERGLVPVENPSAALLAERQPGPGSVVLPTLEGSRPVLVEVQALVTKSVFGYPKRTAAGFDLNRLNVLVAVMTKRAGLNLSDQDIYVNIVGGLKITEPAADLAIILSIASAFKNCSIKNDLVAYGEVGLNGEIRSVASTAKRLTEAKKLGFKRAVGPHRDADKTAALGVKTITQAIDAALESR